MKDTITRRSNNSSSPEDTKVTRTQNTNYNAQDIRDNTNRETEEATEYSRERNSGVNRAPENQPIKYRIGILVSLGLLFVAGSFDVLELILDLVGSGGFGIGVIIGYIKDAISFFFFPLVFFILGAPFWKGTKAKKKIIAMVSSFIISLIPWLGAAMPETFIAVAVTIYLTRSEDRGRLKYAVGDAGKNIIRAKRVLRR